MSRAHSSGHLSAHHHASHRHLLAVERAEYAPHAHLDAVIVPAARSADSLRTAVRLAGKLGCVLVALCSRDASAERVLTLAHDQEVSTVAIDVDEIDDLPAFETIRAIAGSRFERTTDLSRKRNLGLLLSRVAGWQRVMFVDDDIDDVHPSDVRAAAGLLDNYDLVGFVNTGFADNSVVCRAGRYLGLPQDQFIGAGALVVAPHRMATFFPDIYNEDWFFFLGTSRMAVTGSVWHRSFNGAVAASRARQEEFGDCLGEGLFWALDDRKSPKHVNRAHWVDFLGHRRRFIAGLRGLNDEGPRMAEVATALEAAYEESEAIAKQPDLCADYVQLWRSDLATWQKFMEGKPARLGLAKALAELGWDEIAQSSLLPRHVEDRLIFTNGWERSAGGRDPDRSRDRAAQSSQFAPPATVNRVDG